MGVCAGCTAAGNHEKVSGSVAELVEELMGPKEIMKDEGTAIFVGFVDVDTAGFRDVDDCRNFKMDKLKCKACLELQGGDTQECDRTSTPAEQIARNSAKYILKQGKKFEQYLATTLVGDGTVGPLQMVTTAVKTLTANKREVTFDIIAYVVVKQDRIPEVKVEISKNGIQELASKAQELSVEDAAAYLEQTIRMKFHRWAAVSKWRYVTAKDIKDAKGTARYHKAKQDWGQDVPGANVYIRKRMDYNYFVQVNLERVIWQDALINFDLFPNATKDRRRYGKLTSRG